MASILVFGESAPGGGPVAITAELLGAATRLNAALGGDGVACALIGAELDAAARAAVAAGADTVYTAQDAALAQYGTDAYLPVAAAIVEQAAPAVVLFGQTSMGRDLAPRLATRLGSAVAMDALALEAGDGRVRVTRSCYGGNARQVVTVESDPQVVTVRAKSQDPLPEGRRPRGGDRPRGRGPGRRTRPPAGEGDRRLRRGAPGGRRHRRLRRPRPGRARGLRRPGAHRRRPRRRRGAPAAPPATWAGTHPVSRSA